MQLDDISPFHFPFSGFTITFRSNCGQHTFFVRGAILRSAYRDLLLRIGPGADNPFQAHHRGDSLPPEGAVVGEVQAGDETRPGDRLDREGARGGNGESAPSPRPRRGGRVPAAPPHRSRCRRLRAWRRCRSGRPRSPPPGDQSSRFSRRPGWNRSSRRSGMTASGRSTRPRRTPGLYNPRPGAGSSNGRRSSRRARRPGTRRGNAGRRPAASRAEGERAGVSGAIRGGRGRGSGRRERRCR